MINDNIIEKINNITDRYWWILYLLFIILLTLSTITTIVYSFSVCTEQLFGCLTRVSMTFSLILLGLPAYRRLWRVLAVRGSVFVLSCLLYVAMGLVASLNAADKFTHGLTVPKSSLMSTVSERPSTSLPLATDLIIIEGKEVGCYSYQFYYKPTEVGQIYLKAYEVSSNVQLSAQNIKNFTLVDIMQRTSGIVLAAATTDNFKVDEGEPGKPYGARFEVWFVSADGKEERKLFEKVYKIEGWQK